VVGVPWEGGGGGGGTAEGVEVREAAAGMADLHIHKADDVARPEGDAPDRGVQVHVLVDPDQPGFQQLTALLSGEVGLSLGEVMLPSEPVAAVPSCEFDEGGAGGEGGGIGSDKSSVIWVQAAGRPELPQALWGGT